MSMDVVIIDGVMCVVGSPVGSGSVYVVYSCSSTGDVSVANVSSIPDLYVDVCCDGTCDNVLETGRFVLAPGETLTAPSSETNEQWLAICGYPVFLGAREAGGPYLQIVAIECLGGGPAG